MTYYERDYLMRQIEQLAKGLGRFMSLSAVKEIIGQDEIEAGGLSQEEVNSLIVMNQLENFMNQRNLSNAQISRALGIEQERLDYLLHHKTEAKVDLVFNIEKLLDTD